LFFDSSIFFLLLKWGLLKVTASLIAGYFVLKLLFQTFPNNSGQEIATPGKTRKY